MGGGAARRSRGRRRCGGEEGKEAVGGGNKTGQGKDKGREESGERVVGSLVQEVEGGEWRSGRVGEREEEKE